MQKLTILIVTMLLVTSTRGMAQEKDAITGYWLTQEGESQIHIYQSGGQYHGKIVWLDEPYEEDGTRKLDEENPDEDLRDRPLMGLRLLKNFRYDTDDNRWEEGTIYDPETGNTYKCRIWFKEGNENVLHVKG